MKKMFTMILILILAIVVYIGGCAIINEATTLKPDIEIRLVEQPSFGNTARSW